MEPMTTDELDMKQLELLERIALALENIQTRIAEQTDELARIRQQVSEVGLRLQP